MASQTDTSFLPKLQRRLSVSTPYQTTWTFFQLVSMTSIFAGCQFAWAAQIGYATPALRELGMSASTVSFAWLAGPISGVVIQPIVGIWSDHCSSSYGRRRPFLLFGACLTVFGLFFFGNAKIFGELLGDTTGNHKYGIIIAIVSLWFLDFSVNVAQAPVRALIPDLVPSELHSYANAAVAFNNGIGKSLGYLFGAINLPFFTSNTQGVYMIGIVVMMATTSITAINAQERPREHFSADPRSPLGIVMDSLRHVSNLPKPIARAFMVQFWNYFAWYCIFIYLTTWFGETLMKGTASEESEGHEDFKKGVSYGNFALLAMSVISTFASAAFPWLMRSLDIKVLWSLVQLVFLGGLISLIFVESVVTAFFIISVVFSFHFASMYVIPWWIVTRSMEERHERAFFAAIFNLCQCLPDFLVALTASPFLTAVDYNLSLIFLLATIGPVAAIVAIQFIVLPEDIETNEERNKLIPSNDNSQTDESPLYL